MSKYGQKHRGKKGVLSILDQSEAGLHNEFDYDDSRTSSTFLYEASSPHGGKGEGGGKQGEEGRREGLGKKRVVVI